MFDLASNGLATVGAASVYMRRRVDYERSSVARDLTLTDTPALDRITEAPLPLDGDFPGDTTSPPDAAAPLSAASSSAAVMPVSVMRTYPSAGEPATALATSSRSSVMQQAARPRKSSGGIVDPEEEARLWSLELAKQFTQSDAPRLAWPLLVMRRGSKIVVSLVSLLTLIICVLAAQELAAVTGSANAVAGVGLCVDALAAVSSQAQQALWASLGWLVGDVIRTDPFAASASLLELHAEGVRSSCNDVRWNPITSSVPEATTPAVYVDPWGAAISRNVSLWRLAMEVGTAAKVVSSLPERSVAAGDARVQFILENNDLYKVAPTVLQAVINLASSQSSGTSGVVIATIATLSLAVATGIATMWLVVLIERRRNAVLEQLTTIPGAVLGMLRRLANEQEQSMRREAQNGGGGGDDVDAAHAHDRPSGLNLAWAGVSTAMSRRDRERVTRSNPKSRISLCASIVAPLFVVALCFGMLSIAMRNTLVTSNAQSVAASNYIALKLAVARVHVLTSYAAAIPDGPDYADTIIDAQEAIADVNQLSNTVFFSQLTGQGGTNANSGSRAVDVCAVTLGLVGDALLACQAIGGGVLLSGVSAGVTKVAESCSGVLAARAAVTVVRAADGTLAIAQSGANYSITNVLNGPLLSVSRQLESDGPLQLALAIFSAQQIAIVAATAANFLATLNTIAAVLFVVLVLYFSLVFLPFIRTIQRDIDASKMLLRLLPPTVAIRLAGVRMVMVKLTDTEGSAVRGKDVYDQGGEIGVSDSAYNLMAASNRVSDSKMGPGHDGPGSRYRRAPLVAVA